MVDIGRGGLETQADRRGVGEPSVTSLISGIIGDVQELSRQQLALFKAEITADLRRTREVAVAWSIGLGVSLVGGLMLCWMLVYLLNWATEWPLWACFGIVGAVALAVGAVLFYSGKQTLEKFTLDRSVTALKENVQCLTNQT